jgi:hypothetical protein
MIRTLMLTVALLVLCSVSLLEVVDAATACIRQPEGIRIPKTPGDNGYRLKISGTPDKYVPGEVYTGNRLCAFDGSLASLADEKQFACRRLMIGEWW